MNAQNPPELTLERTLEAPRERTWAALTEPERFAQWWGPRGFRLLSLSLDLRVGGLLHYGMQSPGGQEIWAKFTYRAMDPPLHLEFVLSFSDAEGATTRHPWNAEWPLEVLCAIMLDEHAGRTVLGLRAHPIHASEAECRAFEAGLASLRRGFSGTLDQLAGYLAAVGEEQAAE